MTVKQLSILAYITQTTVVVYDQLFIILVTSKGESIAGTLLLFFSTMCTANYMSSCPR